MFRFDGKRVLSTKEALELPRIPLNLAVIGGGISGLEIGTFYAKLGTRVVVVEILDQLLPGTDPEAVRIVARRLQKFGVEVHTKSQARGWRIDKDQTVIDIQTPEGLIARRADVVLVAVGRRPNTDELHADQAGVEFGPRGYVKADRQLRTSNPHVYAVGDVVGPPFLAHQATIVGPDASDLISELALAIEMGASIADIALTIHPHPTLPEAIMESAEAALGEAIHVLNR